MVFVVSLPKVGSLSINELFCRELDGEDGNFFESNIKNYIEATILSLEARSMWL